MTALPKHTEARFEDAIEIALLARGYVKGDRNRFNAEHAVFPSDVAAYVKASQAKKWQSLVDLQGAAAEKHPPRRADKRAGEQRDAVGLAAWLQVLRQDVPDSCVPAGNGNEPGRK